ncbi:acyl-CoA dehydrogenase family protein [Hyphococcus sp.]|uniref:acyl-CoA dehydrogenase family protein n=1 Tax=Hyphococcus sp. TaxID=2038636 RepID=UPI003CCB9C76
MFHTLEKKYVSLQSEAREFAKIIEPLAVEADNMSEMHPGVLAAFRDSQLSDLMVPAGFGGRFDTVDPMAICVVREVLMGTSAHVDSLFALQGIGSYALTTAGSSAQCEKWLPKIARAEAIPALALTEPEAGSDLKSVSTSFEKAGDGFILNGKKSFISNASCATFFVVFAREAETYSMVLAPAETPGISITPSPEIIAPHVLGEVEFNQVHLPAGSRIGDPGDGLKLVLATLGVFRASVAGAAVGLASAALEEAVRHTRSRVQFGRPLSRLGPVAQLLADCWTEIEMARLLTYKAASIASRDPDSALNMSSMAKLGATETASRVVDRCVQVMGRWGLVRDSKIERLYRQARPMRIYEGSSEVLRLGIAKELTELVE